MLWWLWWKADDGDNDSCGCDLRGETGLNWSGSCESAGEPALIGVLGSPDASEEEVDEKEDAENGERMTGLSRTTDVGRYGPWHCGGFIQSIAGLLASRGREATSKRDGSSQLNIHEYAKFKVQPKDFQVSDTTRDNDVGAREKESDIE